METEPVVITVEPPKVEVKEVAPSVKCNCYAYIKKYFFPDLPSTATIRSNLSTVPGDVAVFYYSSSGVYHYAKVAQVDGDTVLLDEANFSSCKVGVREVKLSDPALLGFYNMV